MIEPGYSEMVLHIQHAKAEIVRLSSELEQAKGAVDDIEASLPERNCSCHINPPCRDCEIYGAIRECLANYRKEPTK